MRSRRTSGWLLSVALAAAGAAPLARAQGSPQVRLAVEGVTPRAVEPLTGHTIERDYAAAWKTLADASESGTPAPISAYFAGNAKKALMKAISGQHKAGIQVRYLNQVHNLKAVFYSTDGDVMELQDSAEYQLQVVSDGKVIHDEHVAAHNIVLMTPAADRWVVRQLQAVPEM
jgi:hypothetical protein